MDSSVLSSMGFGPSIPKKPISSYQYPDTAAEFSTLRSFLVDFKDYGAAPPSPSHSASQQDSLSLSPSSFDSSKPKYLQLLQHISNNQSRLLPISLDDVASHCGIDFARQFLLNTCRYRDILYRIVDEMLPPPSMPIEEKSPFDVWITHRLQMQQRNQEQQRAQMEVVGQQGAQQGQQPPQQLVGTVGVEYLPDLLRKYEIQILPPRDVKALKLREVKASCIGSLVTVRGVVTRITDVQPLIRVSAYLCTVCGNENFQVETGKLYNPLMECQHPVCKRNEVKGRLERQTRGSKFVRYQSIRLQELHNEVPVGHVPRTLTLRVQGSQTRQCKPGDLITVSGVFLPERYTGYRAIRAGLTSDTFIDVTHVQPAKKSYEQVEVTSDVNEKIDDLSQQSDVFERLAASIAPEIFGHTDIKKALLLLLVGGVTKNLGDGLKIRGDINILLMGDPGVAKSQLLKHIAHVAPRGVYTTGKGSSGVGLTAAVIRDNATGDLSLEGGSLVLADNGICCIDEFDKMEEGDRTAIHEVMEQQTVSIAKAGITTTLNARTSVLAAANPVYGRWDPRKSVETNLNLPTSLLSRFDLMFIILDIPNAAMDTALAAHVTHVHIHKKHPTGGHASLMLDGPSEEGEGEFEPYSPEFIRQYISRARQHHPVVPKDLTDFIVGAYVQLRKEHNDPTSLSSTTSRSLSNSRQSFCTARSLLSILRLSQAVARLHFRDEVSKDDVEEAMRLVFVSKQSAAEAEEGVRGGRVDPRRDASSEIFNFLIDWAKQRSVNRIPIAEIRPAILRRYKEEDFQKMLEEYQAINVLWVTKQEIRIVDSNIIGGQGDESDSNDE